MEINMLEPATIAVPTMRALPWLSIMTTGWRQLMSDRTGALVPAASRVRAIATPVVDAYRVDGANFFAVCAADNQDHALLVGTSADHKFSTRLGPSASPPV